MRLATVHQSREIDQLSQKVYGTPGEILMESAGAMAAREIDQAFFPELKRGTTCIVCGPGNNGGDGLVVARHMHSAGHRDLMVLTVSEPGQGSSLFETQLERLSKHGIKHIDLTQERQALETLASSSLIVDALFGIGLSRKMEGLPAQVVEHINSSKAPVVSLDAPSGLDCDRGLAEGVVVKAAMTLSFGLAKPGFFVSQGPSFVGRLRVVPIGFPFECLRGIATSHFLFNEKLARRYLPARTDLTNKSSYGHVLVIAGHPGMWGAGVLCSSAAYRMGAGYVTWTSVEEPQVVDQPEILTAPLDLHKTLAEKKISAVAIGPGLGVGDVTASLLKDLKESFKGPVVVDADAITTSVQHKLFPFPENWVLTPHAGELSRILDVEARTIETDRFSHALKAAEKAKCHVLLKGFRSVLAFKERCMVIHAGNSALAKAGTGDVLTGMVAALLGQGLETLQATATAAYIHGRMADEWVRVGNDKRSLLASDLKDHLPQLISRISEGALV